MEHKNTMDIIFDGLETIYMETVMIDLQLFKNKMLNNNFHQNEYFRWVDEHLCILTRDYMYGKIFNGSVQSIIRREIHKHPNMNELSNLIIQYKTYSKSKPFLNLVKKSIEPHFKNIQNKILRKMIFFIHDCHIDPRIYTLLTPYHNIQTIRSNFKIYMNTNKINVLKIKMPKLSWIETAITEFHSILQKR